MAVTVIAFHWGWEASQSHCQMESFTFCFLLQFTVLKPWPLISNNINSSLVSKKAEKCELKMQKYTFEKVSSFLH